MVVMNVYIKTLLQELGLYFFLIFKYLSTDFAQIYRARYGFIMLVCLEGTLTWRPENSETSRTYFGYIGHSLPELIFNF